MSVSSDYKCVVGVSFFGGCGSNNLRLIVDANTPTDYPDFLLFGANTDARVQGMHFGNKEDPKLMPWLEKRALTIHQLGGSEVTKGRGAGADPKVGRQAAETAQSVEAMKAFFEKADEHILVGAVGGGTGTGALPVAAKLLKDMGRTTIAIVITPDPEDGRTKRATEALDEIRALVPTIVINNAYLKEYMQNNMSQEEREKLTFKQAWETVNQHSVVPMIRIIREIIQVTGDMINLDQADWDAMMKYGNCVYFGLAEVEPAKMHETPTQKIVDELFAARFQDPGIISRGKVIGLWSHGPWPKMKSDEIRDLVKARVSADNSGDEIETHRGIVHNVIDGKMWVALIIVADSTSSASIAAPAASTPKLVLVPQSRTEAAPPALPAEAAVVPVAAAEAARTLTPIEPARPARRALVELRFTSGGSLKERKVLPEVAAHFNGVNSNLQASKEDLEKAFDEVEQATGSRPDLPVRFLPHVEEKPAGLWDTFRRRKTGSVGSSASW